MTTINAPEQKLKGYDSKYLVPFSERDCARHERVGGKASKLAEMAQSDFPVPDGCAFTTDCFTLFCSHNNIPTMVNAAENAAQIQRIMTGEFPEILKNQLQVLQDGLPDGLYAVRSSSISEDGQEHSMAGQFDTFLLVEKKDIGEKLKGCWASMYNQAVTAYAEEEGIAFQPKMGVVVQRQIQPQYAGVAFTVDPRTRSGEYIVVEWVEGLGEKLVSGEVTPSVAYLKRTGGVIPDHVPEDLRPLIPDLIENALKAEEIFDCPQDVEWAVDGDFFMLQARPITTLNSDEAVIWSNVNMAENFPKPLHPFTWSVVSTFYTYYMVNILRMMGWTEKNLKRVRHIVHNLTGIHGGRIYYNLSNWYEVLHFFPMGATFQKFLDNYIGQNIPFNYKGAPETKWVRDSWKNPLNRMAFWARLLALFVRGKHHVALFEKRFYEYRGRWRKGGYKSLGAVELFQKIDDLFRNFVDRYYYAQGVADIAVLIFPGLLKKLIKNWFSDHEDNADITYIKLLQGLDLKSTEPAEMIEDMAHDLKDHPELVKLLEADRFDELESRLPEKLSRDMNTFMHFFGSRCYNDCMLVSPTFEERHDLYWGLVKTYSGMARAQHAVSDKGYVKALCKKLPFFKRIVFKIVLNRAGWAIGLREQGRMIRSLLFGELRSITTELGKRLVSLGYIEDHEDVYYFTMDELDQLVYGKFQLTETIPEMITARKRELEKTFEMEIPECFVLEYGNYFEPMKRAEAVLGDQSLMVGSPVSRGKTTGVARVILDPVNDNRLQPGDILITSTTDPGWTPLFRIAGGLILERGGMLSHGAIVAREFGIPAVVGIENATRIIPDGRTLTLNGNNGEVKLHDEET